MVTPRLPPKPSAGGFGGKRRSGEAGGGSASGGNGGSGLCDDAAMPEQGISKILTIDMNDPAKELKIR